MDIDFQRRLLKKHPHIFGESFYFECDEGWFSIIDELCRNITNYLSNNPTVEKVTALQVKEKFGSLRFYISGGDEQINEFIKDAEAKSIITCELTGGAGKMCIKDGFYYKTLSPFAASILGFQEL